MTDLMKAGLTFTAASLGSALIVGTNQAVCVFGFSSALCGLIAFLDRKNRLEVERFEQDIKHLNDQLTNVAVSMGWKI